MAAIVAGVANIADIFAILLETATEVASSDAEEVAPDEVAEWRNWNRSQGLLPSGEAGHMHNAVSASMHPCFPVSASIHPCFPVSASMHPCFPMHPCLPMPARDTDGRPVPVSASMHPCIRSSPCLQEAIADALEQIVGPWLAPEELASTDATPQCAAAVPVVQAASPPVSTALTPQSCGVPDLQAAGEPMQQSLGVPVFQAVPLPLPLPRALPLPLAASPPMSMQYLGAPMPEPLGPPMVATQQSLGAPMVATQSWGAVTWCGFHGFPQDFHRL